MRPFTAASLSLRTSIPSTRVLTPSICRQCLRPISTTPALEAGHNKWSKVKHRKAGTDAVKVRMRMAHVQLISTHSKLFGTDSPQMINSVANARKAGVPKGTIEAAIARGQGRSATGATLENVTIEAIMPPGVALIIEAETDSKGRTLEDLRDIVKKHKGRAGSSAFFFTRFGRVVFQSQPDPPTENYPSSSSATTANANAAAASQDPAGVSVDDVMDDAIEAGAEDLDTDEDGNVVVWTQPNLTAAVTQALGPRFGGRVLSSEIVWSANAETKVSVDNEHEATVLGNLLEVLQDHSDVQAVYANPVQGSVSDDIWARIEDGVDT